MSGILCIGLASVSSMRSDHSSHRGQLILSANLSVVTGKKTEYISSEGATLIFQEDSMNKQVFLISYSLSLY